MARTKKPISAESFLKNGKALKRRQAAVKPAVIQAAKHQRQRPVQQQYFVPLDPSRIRRHTGRVDPSLVVKEAVAQSKHRTYYEIVDNEDKKKKLEFTVTTNISPPPGFTYIPVGHPELTQKCKDISRAQDCMIFVVSMSGEKTADIISDQMHRVGYHFRSLIVEEASASVEVQSVRRGGVNTLQVSQHKPVFSSVIEKLPRTQKEIDEQADAAIRDLFPRIPHTDRRQIIDHAFRLGKTFAGKPVVGLQDDLPLSRRVQLAVLAHIRHTHTRYDKLLRETDWATARATIEATCLEILVKWRGDEETGRDQMDEVLREVVVISDDEESDSEETGNDEDTEMEEGEVAEGILHTHAKKADAQPPSASSHQPPNVGEPSRRKVISLLSSPHHGSPKTNSGTPMVLHQNRRMDKALRRDERKAQRNERKGFKRYEAWKEALSQQQRGPEASSENIPQRCSAQGPIYRTDTYDHNPAGFLPYHGDAYRSAAGPASSLQVSPRKATFGSGEFIDLTESPYREKVTSRHLVNGHSRLVPLAQHGLGLDRLEIAHLGQHSSLVRDRATLGAKPLSSPKSTLQDYLLPSIEQAPDRALENRYDVPALPRKPETSQCRVLQTSTRGFPLMADGTYRDAYGVLRNEDDRRIIYVDENNREVDHGVGSSREFSSNFGEGSSATATLSRGTAASSTMYGHESAAMDSRSPLDLSAVRNPLHVEFGSSSSRLEGRNGNHRETNGAGYHSRPHLHSDIDPVDRHQPSSMPSTQGAIYRESEVPRPRFYQDVAENYNRVSGEFSRVVHPVSPSHFSEKNRGIARAEQFSHSSSKLRENVGYGQGDYDEPVLLSQTMNGAVRYFQEPVHASRTQYGEALPSRRPASTVQHGASRRVIEYIDLDSPKRGSESERVVQEGYAPRHPDGRMDNPLNQVRLAHHGDPLLHDSRTPIRREIADRDYLY